MVRLFALILATLIAVTRAERLEFSSLIPYSGTQCFLENIGETIQGKTLFQLKYIS